MALSLALRRGRFALIAGASLLLVAGCTPQESETPSETSSDTAATQGPPAPPPDSGVMSGSFDSAPFKGDGKTVTKGGLTYEEMKVGTGAEAKEGSRASVHYTGTLMDGSKFDSSRDRGEPFTFTIGAGEVIKGWDIGVEGMKIGGRRKLTIPYELAYGEEGRPPTIPEKATLIFDVELMGVE